MNGTLIRRVLLAPAVILTAGACFATRNDVRILQSEMQAMRAEADTARTAQRQLDAAERARLDSVLVSIIQQLGIVGDTVRSMHATTMRLRGDVREDLVAIRQQLITVEERVGASARRIQELRAGLEADAAERAAAPVTPPTPADTAKRPPTAGTPGTAPAGAATAPATAAQPPAPGPAQLLQLAQEQLRGGRNGAARSAFGSLLQQHPSSDLAPDALFGIAQAYENEGAGSSADSVYALVAQRYPNSDRAPTALYKRATALRVTGRTDDAKTVYKQIVDKYPRSDAAVLAAEFLGARKP